MFDRHLYDRMLKEESIEDKIMSAGAFFLLIIGLLVLVGVLYMLLTGV